MPIGVGEFYVHLGSIADLPGSCVRRHAE
jgi:hypothetical protein